MADTEGCVRRKALSKFVAITTVPAPVGFVKESSRVNTRGKSTPDCCVTANLERSELVTLLALSIGACGLGGMALLYVLKTIREGGTVGSSTAMCATETTLLNAGET